MLTPAGCQREALKDAHSQFAVVKYLEIQEKAVISRYRSVSREAVNEMGGRLPIYHRANVRGIPGEPSRGVNHIRLIWFEILVRLVA